MSHHLLGSFSLKPVRIHFTKSVISLKKISCGLLSSATEGTKQCSPWFWVSPSLTAASFQLTCSPQPEGLGTACRTVPAGAALPRRGALSPPLSQVGRWQTWVLLSLASSSLSVSSLRREYAARVCELCRAYRCNREQDRQQARSPAKQCPGSQPGPELSVTQQEIPEVKLLTLLEVLCYSWLNRTEKAPGGVPFCVMNALPGRRWLAWIKLQPRASSEPVVPEILVQS